MSAVDFYGVEVASDGDPGPAPTEDVLRVFDVLRPRACATPLIRIGGDLDGAYLVPDDLEGISACFSPGVNKIKYFEDYLLDRHGIASHMCDYTCEASDFVTPLREGRQTFAKKWLDVEPGEDNLRLEDWVRDSGAEGDLLLQIDIEGAEYRNLLAAPEEVLSRFRIIVLEVHGLGRMLDPGVLRDAIGPFFDRLGRSFTCVHAHPNNCCGEVLVPGTDVSIPNVLELTFLRHDRFRPGPGRVLLPHPLDVSRNVPRNAPLFLSEAWCEGGRPLESRVKILEDTLRYREEVGSATADQEVAGVLALTMQSIQTAQGGAVATGPRAAVDRPDRPELTEVAAGRPYRLSSSYGSTSRTGTVAARQAYFFHTAFGAGPSIRVDLGRRQRVARIVVTNRTDGFQDRARFLFVTLTGGGLGGPRVFPMYQEGPLARGAWAECTLELPDVSARYVTIGSPTNTALHFSDLRVYAAPTAEPASSSPAAPAPPAGPRRPHVRRAARRALRVVGPRLRRARTGPRPGGGR